MDEIKPNTNYSGTITQIAECVHSVFNKGVKYGRYLERHEKRRGAWYPDDMPLGLEWRCSCCKNAFSHMTNFCPDCGAYMRGEQDAECIDFKG